MATKTYTGGCHCGRVRYSAEIDLSKIATKCNCSYCMKTRAWTTPIAPSDLRLLSGADALVNYHQHEQAPLKHFCGSCGVVTHADGDADYMGGPFAIVFLATLDDAPPQELAATPVRYCNGRENRWQEPPAITSYL